MISLKGWLCDAVDPGDRRAGWGARVAAGALAGVLVSMVFYFSFHQLNCRWNWAAVYKYRWNLLSGWCITIVISGCALVPSPVIGILFALARRSAFLPLRY